MKNLFVWLVLISLAASSVAYAQQATNWNDSPANWQNSESNWENSPNLKRVAFLVG